MINYLHLNNFKGIESISFDGLGRVNLIIGGNNTGKTSVLEALTLLFGNNDQLHALPRTFRQRSPSDDWLSYWSLIAKDGNIDLFSIETDVSIARTESAPPGTKHVLRFPPDGEPNSRFRLLHFGSATSGSVNPLPSPVKLSILSTSQPDPLETSKLFNEIAPLNPDNENKLEDLLRRSIEPRLRRLRYAKPKGANDHLVYVDLGNGPMIPFTQMGQAFSRALHIYCEIFALNPDMLLVDEIENGLYFRGLKDFWKGLIAVLEDQGVQLFATTHSRECMEAACQANDEKTDLRYLRLDRQVDRPEQIVGTVITDKSLSNAMEFGDEMR